MNETELERIVVRLVGDGSQYQKMLTDAAAQTTKAADLIKQAANRIEGFKNSLVGFGQQMLGALGMFGVASSLKGAFDASQQLEQGQIRLRNTIQATGQDVGSTTARFTALAESISKDTLLTKGQVFAMIQRATAMGLNAETAERVVRNSVALAGATGQEAEGLLRAAAAIERGNYQLARRQLGLQGVKDETELVRIVNNMMVGGMKTQEEIANTASGRIEKLGRSLRSLNIEIGGMVSQVIQPLVDYISQAINQFNSLDSATKKIVAGIVGLSLGIKPLLGTIRMASSVFLNWQGVLLGLVATAAALWARMTYGADNALKVVTDFWEGIKDAASEWMDYFVYAIQNLDKEWERFTLRAGLAFLTFASDLKFYFEVRLKDVVTTWASNYLLVVRSMLSTAFDNYTEFARRIQSVNQLLNDIVRGRATATQFAQVLAGFSPIIADAAAGWRNTVEQARVLSPLEIEMRQRIDRLDAEFQNRFLDFRIGRNRRATERRAEEFGLGVGRAFTGGVKAGIDNIDAVLARSAEAFTRLANYRDAIFGNRPNPITNRAPAASPLGTPAQVAALVGGGAGPSNAGAVMNVLGQIAQSTRQTAERPPVQINAANLEE